MDKKSAEESAARKSKETRMKAGRSQGMSGRDLFEFNPALAQDLDEDDEEDAIDFSAFDREEAEKERDRLENEKFLASTGNLSLQDNTAAY